jgi:hypothetical protein
MTVGVLQAVAQAKLAIPVDIAVVSFDDMSWAPLLQPPLTAVAQPAGRLHRRRQDGHSVALLARQGDLDTETSPLPPGVVERALRGPGSFQTGSRKEPRMLKSIDPLFGSSECTAWRMPPRAPGAGLRWA